MLDAYKLVASGSWLRPTYALEVRYLKMRPGAKANSSTYYAYSAPQSLPIDFVSAPPHEGPPADGRAWQSLETAKAQVADVDGDGRADLITWGYDNTWAPRSSRTRTLRRLEVFRQTDAGFVRHGTAGVPLTTAVGHSPKGLRVQDLNQDGLSDLIYFVGTWYKKKEDNVQWTGNWHYRLSTGAGFTDATQLTHVAAGAQAPSSLSLYDDNGDGYPDVLWHDVKAKQVSLKHYDPTTGAFASGAPTKVRATLGKDEEQYFTADVNGDGQGDLLHVADSGDTETLKTYLHQSTSRPHLITRITNGLGARTTLTYESLSRTDAYARIDGVHTTRTGEQRCFTWGGARFCWPVQTATLNAADFYTALNTPWADTTLTDSLAATSGDAPVLELMGPLYVVTRVDSSAPTGTDADATSSICYMYEQAKLQAAGQGLLGFKALTTIDLQTGVATTTTYRQDFPYIGYPLKTEVKTRAGHLLRTAGNTWRLTGYQGDDPATPGTDESWGAIAAAQGSAVLGALQPYLAKAVETTYDLPTTKTVNNQTTTTAGAKLSTVTTTNTYDDWGNPTGITVTTADHANGKQFRQVTENTYGSTEDSKRYGRLTEAKVTRQRDEAADGAYETTGVRTSQFSYYPSDMWEHLLRTETLAPGNTRLEHETTYHYDTFGQRVRAVVKAAGDKSGRRTETRCNVDTVQYDTSGRYVIKAWDCLGRERRTLSGHNGWGQPATVAQVVNAAPRRVVSTTHTYTPGGGPAVSRESAGGWTGQRKARCTGSVAHCPSGAAYYIETRQAGGGRQWDYRDKLDRVVRTRTAGFADKTWVLTDTEYDNLGRVARQSEPYYAGKTRHWTSYTYDLLGRVVRTTLPDYETDANDAVTVNSVITTAYNGFTTTTTNGKGQRTTETRNALGEAMKSTDNAGTPVTHTYDAWGQVIKTTTGTTTRAVSVAWEYDARGRRTAVADPHWPAWRATRYQYTWNGFDELIEQADRLGNRLEMTYDGLGRLLTRTETQPGDRADEVVVATWRYDTAANGLGRPGRVAQRVGLVTEQDSYRRTHAYDRYGRASDTALTVQVQGGTQTYHTRQTWDEYGRPHQHFDARPAARFTDHVTEVHYNESGYAYRWTDGVYVKGKPRHTYRELTALDARGNVTKETLGGGVVRTRRSHDVKTGRIEGITTKDALLRTAQADTYGWDVLGNLTARTGVVGNDTLTESFTYDTRNRLTKAGAVLKQDDPVTNATTTRTLTPQAVSYDALGNITRKSGVGTYTYGADHPYAVTATRSTDNRTTTYVYDVQGNQVSGAGRTLEYTAFNKLKGIDKGLRRTAFTYGPDRARSTRTDTARTGNGRSTTTTVYLGNVEHVIAEDGSSTWKRYLANGAVLITQDHNTLDTRTAETTHYLLRDHLGSLTAILDQYGTDLESFSYDAWGQRRTPGTAAMLALLTLRSALHSRTTTRGYTGHEMLDAHGIIHMNGRIYDPKLGRFLQADPIVQFPHYSQGWNTYSYVLNNPLTYTDPSGHFIPVFAAIAAGISIGLKVKLVTAAILIGAGVFADSLAQGAPLDKAFLAGVSAGALTALAVGTLPGSYGLNLATFKHVATVATVGGITASLQGGKFGHGFLSAGAGAAAGGIPLLGKTAAARIAARTVVSAVTAGTVSEITGGKFANGAMTAAFFSLVSSVVQRANGPNFSEMSNQELTDWIHKNGAEFGIETSDGLNVIAIDEYRQFDETLGWIECSDALCGDSFDTVIYGHYDKGANLIELFKPAFEAGFHSFALSHSSITGYNLSRPAIAVQSFGHEAAHSIGVDIIHDIAPTHYNAERFGLDAMRRFQNKYE